MIKTSRFSLLLLFSFFALLWVSCSQSKLPCEQPTAISLNIACYHVLIDTFGNRTIFGRPLPNGEIGYINAKGVPIPKAYLPQNDSLFSINSLSPVSDSSRWFILTDTTLSANEKADTFTFIYTRNLKFLSNACGYTYYYNLTGITYTLGTWPVDSVIITNPSVTNNINVNNVKIYYHQ